MMKKTGLQLYLPLSGTLLVVLLITIPFFGLATALMDIADYPLPGVLADYVSIITQSRVIYLLGTTTALALSVSLISCIVGLWLAWVEQRALYPGVKWLSLLNLLPLAIPSYLLAATLREALAPGSILGSLFGLPAFQGFIPAVLVLSLITIPYVQLLTSVALSRLSSSEEEVARCLGSSPQQVFRHIILPCLRPSLAFAWLITLLYVISDFGAVAVLDTQVLTWRLYQAIEIQQVAKAAILGVSILIIGLPLILLARWIHGYVPTVSNVSNPRSPERTRVGYVSLVITYGLHFIVIGLGAILPFITLIVWVYHGWYNQVEFASLWSPIRDTALVALPSAFFIVLLAWCPAFVAARARHNCAMLIEQGIYLTRSLPGILLAFGLLLGALYFTGAIMGDPGFYHYLLSSGLLLFAGYAMRFIPEAYASLKSAILLFDPRLRENARLFDPGVYKYLAKVSLPALFPGLSVAFILVLLSLIKELPVTLLLGGAMGIRTLSFRIFDRYQEAFLHDAGLSGLILLALTFSLVAITLPWRRHA